MRILVRSPLRSARIDVLRHVMAGSWHNAPAVRVRGVFSAGTRRPTRTASAVDVKLRRFAKWPSLPLRLMLRARQPRLLDTGCFWLRLRRSWSGAWYGRGVHAPRTPHDRMCLWAFSQNHDHIIQHIDAEDKLKSMRGGLPWGLGAQPQLQIQISPNDKVHRLSAESRGASGGAVAEPSLRAVGV